MARARSGAVEAWWPAAHPRKISTAVGAREKPIASSRATASGFSPPSGPSRITAVMSCSLSGTLKRVR